MENYWIEILIQRVKNYEKINEIYTFRATHLENTELEYKITNY